MTDVESVARSLAKNVFYLRKERLWTQAQLAERAGIPRSTITNIESGLGNPSLNNLARLAQALQVSVEELLAKPRSEVTLIKATEIPLEERGRPGSIVIHKLFPDAVRGIAIDRIHLASQARMQGMPHIHGAKEYLTVIKGTIVVGVAGDRWRVEKGDVLAFPGDQPHAYLNPMRSESIGISVVLPL